MNVTPIRLEEAHSSIPIGRPVLRMRFFASMMVASMMLSSLLACQEPATPTATDQEMSAYAEIAAAAVSNPFTQEALDHYYMPFGFVAHALGEIDGESYTNSRQAFERSYERGFRVFEADMVRLADGTVWTVHDNYEERYGLPVRFDRLTASDLEQAKLDGKYDPIRMEDLLRRISELGDVWVILDTKAPARNLSRSDRIDIHVSTVRGVVEAAAEHPDALDRLVPHIGGEDDYVRIHEMHPFPHYMFAIYRSDVFEDPNWSDDAIVRFVADNEIDAVMMWWNRRYEPGFDERLRDVGAAVYVHSLNDRATIDRFREAGVGVYSDGLIYP